MDFYEKIPFRHLWVFKGMCSTAGTHRIEVSVMCSIFCSSCQILEQPSGYPSEEPVENELFFSQTAFVNRAPALSSLNK